MLGRKKEVMGKKKDNTWHILVIAFVILFLGFLSQGTIHSYQIIDVGGQTLFGNVIDFLRKLGFFSVLLPFLLVFAIVFGILEKSKLFGTEKTGDKEYPKRNLNSIVAFCVAFFVIAASNITGVIQATMPQIALVLIFIIAFLLLFGSLMGHATLEKGKGILDLWAIAPGINKFFITAIFIAMMFILLGAFGALDSVLGFIFANISGTFITLIIFFLLVVLAIWFVTKGSKKEEK